MKVVQTNALIQANDWLVLVNEKEKKAQFVNVQKVTDVTHTGLSVMNGLGDWLSIDAGGGILENVKDSDVQNVYFLKEILRGNAPLFLFLGDDPIFSNPQLTITMHIRDSEFKDPTRLTVPCASFSPAGSNFVVQIDSFSRAGFNHLAHCNTASHKDVAVVHAFMTWA